jgi:mRNA interferase RelE/StbE
MSYRIDIPRAAARELAAVAEPHKGRIKAAIQALADDPRPSGCVKMTGLRDIFRIRIGDYRVTYQVQDRVLVVIVVKVGHRREVYR